MSSLAVPRLIKCVFGLYINAQGNVVVGNIECILDRAWIQRLRLYYFELCHFFTLVMTR